MRSPTFQAAVLFLLLGAACSATHEIARPASLESFAALSRAQGGPIDVLVEAEPQEAANGEASLGPLGTPPPVAARLLDVRDGGIVVAGRSGRRVVSLDDVHGYDVTTRVQGAVEGWTWGLLGGVAVGALTGFIAGDDPPCDPNEAFGCLLHFSASDKALVGGVLGGVVGMLGGAIAGALLGHTDHYAF